jgi:ABC-2 type transport system ATP-binding protein
LWTEVERLRAAGKTIVLTTHYIEEAERLSDRICMVQRGRIVAEATPTDLIAHYGGAATVSIVAQGFTPGTALEALGAWTKTGDEWKLATRTEPGLALAEIVTHANAINAKITLLDMHRPTLEDAFIAITGEAIEEVES